jgi:L,D-transpeptidase YcbB
MKFERLLHIKFKLILPLLCCLGFVHCGNSEVGKEMVHVVARDTAINAENAYSQLELDSAVLEKYISENITDEATANRLRSFYNSRNFHLAWFATDGLTEQLKSFWNLHNQYIEVTKDSAVYDKPLHDRMASLLNEDEVTKLEPAELANTEIHLTQHFFEYVKNAYQGKVDPSEFQWHIPRKKLDAIAVLDSLLDNNGKNGGVWEPVSSEYTQLKKHLPLYRQVQQQGGWPQIQPKEKVLKPGDSSIAIRDLKVRLRLTGDYNAADTSYRFTPELEAAVKQAQQRFGLAPDGVVGPATLRAFNVPVQERIKQMLVNMERLKWMPEKDSGRHLVANIPAFTLYVYEGDKEMFNMKIVVGKAGTSSVIFSDKLEYVVFSPYWNVPRSIVRNEILPAMQRNPNYLDRSNMEQTGTSGGLPVIRQKPGGSNALGRVKFIFPNNYNIYFHDTPAKHLFSRNDRAFSHGCIRLEEPQRLAEYLLQDNEQWTSSSISDAMHAETEKWVKLDKKVPVLIGYFTSWIDNDGLVNFRDDIYGHDQKLMARLFE